MNKKFFTALLALFAFAAASGAQGYVELYEGEAVSAMRKDCEILLASEEKSAADYIRERFSAEGLEVLESEDDKNFGIVSPEGDTLIRHNALAFIQGYDRSLKDRYIVIGAPIAGNASGAAALIRLAKMLRTNSVLLRRSVILAAFGGEKMQNAGSWYFINRSFKGDAARADAMIDLSYLGEGGQGFYAYTASNDDLNRTVKSLSNSLQPIYPQIIAKEPAVSSHRSFYAAQIPSVQFISGAVPKLGKVSEMMDFAYLERICEYIYNFTVEIACGEAPEFMPSKRESPEREMKTVPWSDCDVKPAFMNNADPSVFLERWVYVYLKYPQYALENGIQGKVLVDFVIDERGRVRDARVLRGVHPSLDGEALKVISASPDWKPARVRGKKVNCSLSLYVEFRLKKK